MKYISSLKSTARIGYSLGCFIAAAIVLIAGCSPITPVAPAATSATTEEVTATEAMTSTEAMSGTDEMTDTDEMAGTMAETLMVSADATLGDILVDAKGMTLYLFTKDSPGESVCSGGCAEKWPPYIVQSEEEAMVSGPGVTGQLGTITREDGSLQVTYNDIPLYYYYTDEKPGDITGQDVGEVWYAVTPDGQAAGE